jgi:hypothetical protein
VPNLAPRQVRGRRSPHLVALDEQKALRTRGGGGGRERWWPRVCEGWVRGKLAGVGEGGSGGGRESVRGQRGRIPSARSTGRRSSARVRTSMRSHQTTRVKGRTGGRAGDRLSPGPRGTGAGHPPVTIRPNADRISFSGARLPHARNGETAGGALLRWPKPSEDDRRTMPPQGGEPERRCDERRTRRQAGVPENQVPAAAISSWYRCGPRPRIPARDTGRTDPEYPSRSDRSSDGGSERGSGGSAKGDTLQTSLRGVRRPSTPDR